MVTALSQSTILLLDADEHFRVAALCDAMMLEAQCRCVSSILPHIGIGVESYDGNAPWAIASSMCEGMRAAECHCLDCSGVNGLLCRFRNRQSQKVRKSCRLQEFA